MFDEYVQWKCPNNISRTYQMNMPICSAQTLQCEGTTRMSERSNVRSACCPLPPAVHRHCGWLTGQRRGLSNDIHFEIMKSYTHTVIYWQFLFPNLDWSLGGISRDPNGSEWIRMEIKERNHRKKSPNGVSEWSQRMESSNRVTE